MPERRPGSRNREAGEDDATKRASARNDQRQSGNELDRSGQETKRGTKTDRVELLDHEVGARQARTCGRKRRGTRQRLQDVDPGRLHDTSPVGGLHAPPPASFAGASPHRGSERSDYPTEFKKTVRPS